MEKINNTTVREIKIVNLDANLLQQEIARYTVKRDAFNTLIKDRQMKLDQMKKIGVEPLQANQNI